MSIGNTAYKTGIFCLLGLPVIIYCVLINKYAYDFPFLDDYETVLDHLLRPVSEQFIDCFIPHNEHIHWVLKAVASIDSLLFGTVNFVRLIWAGVLFLLMLYALLLRTGRNAGIPWLFLLPVPFLLFQPSYWGTMTWATTSLHNFPGIVFALAAFTFWTSEGSTKKPWAIVLLILSLFTHGFGIAACLSILTWELNQRRFSAAVLPFVLVVGWLLFRNSLTSGLGIPAVFHTNPLLVVHFFFNFLGSGAHFLGSPGTIAVGVGTLTGCVILIRKGLVQKNPALCLMIVYLLICALLVTAVRADMGPKQGLASRYRIISALLLCSVYLGFTLFYWKNWTQSIWINKTLIAAACTFFVVSLLTNIHNLEKIKTRLQEDQLRWIRNEPIQEFPHPAHAARILKESEAASIYSPGLPR